MTDIMEARRKGFEAWVSGFSGITAEKISSLRVDDGYLEPRIESAWFGYNAALDSVCVELPDTVANTGTINSNAVLSYKRECREAIERAGLKVKP